MLNLELLKQVLMIAIASGCVTTLAVQKIKEQLKSKKWLFIISFLISMIIGTLFAKSFSDANWEYCVWAGLFTWLDANILYLAFEDKIFKKFSDINNITEIKREDEE